MMLVKATVHDRLTVRSGMLGGNNMRKGRKMSITSKAKDMPEIYKKNYLASVSGKASPRNAIKAFCIECMGYVRGEVTDCDTIDCPLNLYRPYRKAGDSDD